MDDPKEPEIKEITPMEFAEMLKQYDAKLMITDDMPIRFPEGTIAIMGNTSYKIVSD